MPATTTQPGTRGRALRPTAKVLPGHARVHNRSLVLAHLFHTGPSSRADIARSSGLTRVTVSTLVADLIEEGLVEELGVRSEGKVGKPATLVGMRTEAFQVVAVDLTDDATILGAVLTLTGEVVSRHEAPLDGRSGEAAVVALEGVCRALLAAADRPVIGVGIASPGVIRTDGLVVQAPNRGWYDLELATLLHTRLGVPVHVANDANARALGEFTYGSASGSGSMVVTVGQGVGAGLVVDGALVLGRNNAAGEIGHVTVVDATTPGETPAACACGRAGCLETVLSVPALRRRVAGLDPQESDAALASVGRMLGIALAPVVSALDLAEVLLSGPTELLDGPLREAALTAIRTRTMPVIGRGLAVRMGSLDEDGALAGAAVLVLGAARGHVTTPSRPLAVSRHHPGERRPGARLALGRNPNVKMLRFAALGVAATLALTACSSGSDEPADGTTTAGGDGTQAAEAADITLWLAGGDTNKDLRTYLVDTFAEQNPGSTLTIEEVAWPDLVTKLTTALPDAANTPDVVEIGNTQSPTFTTVGAFRDLTPLYDELGGDKLLQSFVDVGSVDGKNFALPYYFGSRYMFYRKDIWTAAGVEVPQTLAEFTEAVAKLKTDTQSGFAMGGQDWRNGISWVFANGGELATVDGTTWTSTLSDPSTIKGLEQWQEVYQKASNLPSTERDVAYWDFLNDGTDGTGPDAATIMAPGWARWSIGDITKNDAGEEVRDGMADDTKFDIFALPGVEGGIAPVFAGGSNIAVSAKSQHPELAENLLRIIFSEEYQTMLGGAGLGPGNSDYVSSLGDDKFAQTMIETAAASKLTPAAPGWAAIEGAFVYEELFQKIADGGDVTALAKEYDAKLTPMLNGGAAG